MGYWEIQLSGRWKSIGRVVGEACNDAKARGAKQVTYSARGCQYVIDFPTMTQTNIRSHKARYIRERGAEIMVYPDSHPEVVEEHSSAPDAPAKTGGSIAGKVGTVAVVGGGMAAAAVGVALLSGAIDMGDISDAAQAAGDALGDIDLDGLADLAGDAADMAADVGADAAVHAGTAATAVGDAAAAAADGVMDLM